MSRKALVVGIALLLLAGGGALLKSNSSRGPASIRSKAMEAANCFETAEDARRYVVERLWHAPGTDWPGDSYTKTFTRRHGSLERGAAEYYLVNEPARELELALGFLKHGFGREACAHARHLFDFHPASPEARVAGSHYSRCCKATVLGLVSPTALILEDAGGERYVCGDSDPNREPDLDRIQEAWLGPTTSLSGSVRIVGHVDENGGFVIRDASTPFQDPHKLAPVADARSCYLVHGAVSLLEVERRAKARILTDMAHRVGGDARELRRIADAFLYIGLGEEAAALLSKWGKAPPDDPLASHAAALARDPRAPLHLDALWQVEVRDRPRFRLFTRSSVTATAEFPVELDSRAIDRMNFSFARLQGPFPAKESELKAWLDKAEAKHSHVEVVPVVAGSSTLRLPVRVPGAYRVTAQAAGLSCTFLAVRADLAIDALSFPGQTIFSTEREGVTIAVADQVFGTTGPDRLLASPATADSPGRIFVTGHGQFFRATVRTDASARTALPPPAPILFVHTDRPVYKAGDTMRFRGVLRLPRMPIQKTDESRLLPGAEREVAVSIRCGETALFHRTYVTGEQGTFNGEFALPLTAYRAEYALKVTLDGVSVSQPFEVLDYRKSDYAVVLAPAAGGLRVRAGYVWGAPVPGTRLRCTIGDRVVESKDEFIPAKDGQSVRVALLRGEEELAQKSIVFRAPVGGRAPEAAKPAEPKPAADANEMKPTPPAQPAAPTFSVRTSKELYRRGEEIEVQVSAPWPEAEAIVLLGDVMAYDLARVPIRDGRGTVRFVARPIHDPGVQVFAICNGLQDRAGILVRADRMNVAIEAPAKGRPGETVEVKLRGDPKAALALSAVDEAIYMIREEDTPEIYSVFHPTRPAAFSAGRLENFEYDGESHTCETKLEDPRFRTGLIVKERLSVYEIERSRDVFSRMGTLKDYSYVARAGGNAATLSPVLKGLLSLAAAQRADGSWPSAYASEAGTLSEVGATGLSMLSFLGAGYSQLSKDEFADPGTPGRILRLGEVVKKSLQWLVGRQDAAGRIGPAQGDFLLNHAMAALALSEAYGMTAALPLKEPAQRAINYLASQQSTNGGWNRTDLASNGEILAGTFGVMALKSAQLSELVIAPNVSANAFRFFNQAVRADGLCAGTPTRVTVAGSMLSLIFLRSDRQDPRLAAAAAWLGQNAASWDQGDFIGWYFASLALFQHDGPGGPCWTGWHEPAKSVLAAHQVNGSWSAGTESIAPTALGSMTLEVYYRYANAFGGGGAKAGDPKKDDVPLAPAPQVRVYFPDTVLWAPEILADEKGEARVSFRLPEQITATRLTARGITKGGTAGQAVARIETQQPFFVKIQSPEFLVAGDEVEIRAEVFNYTGQETDATVRLEGFEARKVRVPADRPASASWRLVSKEPGSLKLVAIARAGTFEDAMERAVPVRRVGRETLATSRGTSETGQSYRFDAPAEAQDLVVRVQPRRGTLPQLLDALRYLNGYPYG